MKQPWYHQQRIQRCLRNDRRIIQTVLVVSTIFCVNFLQLWRYHSDLTQLAASNDWLQRQWWTHHDNFQLPNDDDYNVIFCNATTRRAGGSANDNNSSSNNNNRRRPIFIWGIPSTNSDYELKRRKLLRETYLDFFHALKGKQITNTTNYNYSDDKDRICSLQEWTCDYHRLRNKCQIIYVFFIGGNSEGKPELLDESLTNFRDLLYEGKQVLKAYPKAYANSNSSNATTTPPSRPPPPLPKLITVDKHEPGVVYLNIKENQFDGKMTTWFQFAALVGDEFPEIDYAAKVDSDLLLFTPNFLEYMEEQEQQHETRKGATTHSNSRLTQTYGGIEFPATNCVVNYTFDHPCPLPLVGPSYMSGELNFMSMDLARYIVSDDCPREELTIPHEDVSLSNYVYSYTNNTVYHDRMRRQNSPQHDYSNHDNNHNHTIDIISINKTRILITPTLTADWEQINVRMDPEIFSKLLWGHSIRRGDHQRYLVFKKDRTFRIFWERYMRAYNNGWKRIGGGGASNFVPNKGGSTGMTPEKRKQMRDSLLQRRKELGIKQLG